MSKIIIIGAGAAGIFAAINIASKNHDAKVVVLEKSSKLLSKVKISGGGRCNVTNVCSEPKELIKNYPRGNKKLKKAFEQFGTLDTVTWFESRGVKLKAELDGRMFPVTDDSQTIIDCLLNECKKHKVDIKTKVSVESIEKTKDGFSLSIKGSENIECQKILIATGGHNKLDGFQWLANLGHSISEPVPSLFTFNLPTSTITELSGVSVQDVEVKIAGTKLAHQGPLLITHWGLSGPAVLKLSAWGARILQEKNYEYSVLVNWLKSANEEETRQNLTEFQVLNPKKMLFNSNPFQLPKRLWEYLLTKSEIDEELRWNNFSGKKFNKLINNLIADLYEASGKTTFKEEFVTAGGVKLGDVNMQSMESRKCPGLFFAGEVLDIDGVTGGFNFQAAWTTAWLVAQGM
ncbi:NAD(P)/FAD-dependent oxidoreductase [Marivirga sp.]|uniref:NAD(P)/FAD-dependent oxidoreductase n=1 Tax=Marivirga sp. TaxID=2018662 RepID=UPI002D808BE6|nr:NAD(P)/FAD-dependent oxidoreductase [Marivirga sp.]HET8858409.1 NAD(P)/FAD-dependent oxidoreductase [Marivirga sp.]